MCRKTQIEDLLGQHKLADCVVLNPYSAVNEKGKDVRADTWANSHRNRRDKVNSDTLKNVPTYLEAGKTLAKDAQKAAWAGVCQTFACASIFLISSNVQNCTSIELVSFGNKFSGHVFVVVDRDPNSEIAQPSTWGERTLVVDQWYANQKNNAGLGVYELKTNLGYDATYFDWLKDHTGFKVVLTAKRG